MGRITGVYGVRGWVRVRSDAKPPENLLNYPVWQLCEPRQGWTERRLAAGRAQGAGLVASFEGIADRDLARALIGADIAVPRTALPPAEPGSYYWHDLIGLAVATVDGKALGQVVRLHETGAHDVLEVTNGCERLIPFVMGTIVQQVDLAQRRIVVDWDPEE